MIADKPNFTDSELNFMESILQEDKNIWMKTFQHSPDFEEIKNEYESILEKIKKWRTEQHNWNKAFKSLTSHK